MSEREREREGGVGRSDVNALSHSFLSSSVHKDTVVRGSEVRCVL